MLDSNLKAQLKAYLERVKLPFVITASLDEGKSSQEMHAFLQDIVGLTDKITLKTDGTDARRPSFTLARPGEEERIRFAAIPMGHEFTSLVLALLQVGGHPPKIEQELIDQIKNLDSDSGELRFETYMSLTCHNCPDVVQALNLLAVLNPRVKSVVIDGGLYQQEVENRQVLAVPMVFLNGELFGQGRMEVDEIVKKLDTGSAARDAAKLGSKDAFDVLIVGGGPAGAAAAVYAARKGIRTGLLAERMGGQTMDTMSIENFISVLETDGPKFAAALEQHAKRYEVDIMNLQRASKLQPAGADGLVGVTLENGATLKSKTVIVSTGARWREVNVPGEKEYRNKGVAYCPHCDGPLFKGKRVAVIGGGNSGVEAAIDLAGIVAHVTLIEFDSELRADAVLQRKLASLPNVKIVTSALTTEVHGDGTRVNGLTYKDRNHDSVHRVDLEGVFVQIGLVPNTEWLKDSGVALSARGEIEVDYRGATSLPGVFAAGDATTTPYKHIVIAMGEGSKAALSAFDYLIRLEPAEQPAQAAA